MIGKWPTLSIDKARKLATKYLQDEANGNDPQAERLQQRKKVALGLDKAESVAFVWREYERKHIDKKLKPLSVREIKRIGAKDILPKIGKRNIAEVTPRECKALVKKVIEHAPVGGNRTQAVLHAFFNWAIDQLLIGTNPCAGLKKPTSEKHRRRRRILSEREIKWLWKACDTVGFPWGPMLQVGVLTGARRGELAGMAKDELDLVARLWSLPASRTKNHRPHVIWISNQFNAVLNLFPEHKGEFVFSDRKRPPSGFSKSEKIYRQGNG